MSSYGGRGPTVNAALWTETALALILVMMRIYTRVRILRSFGWDDGLLILTWCLLALYASLISVGTMYGIGQKRADIPPEDYTQAMKYEIIGQGACIFNIAVSKAGVAFFLLRIVFKWWHKALIWLCVITNSIVATFGTIAVFVQCTPVQRTWDISVAGKCTLDFPTIGLFISGYAVAMDFILALAPCFIIWELNMKRKEKLVIISGLSLGVFAGLCGILRTTALTSLASFDEYIYDTVDMLIYSGTENFVTAMCASIPVLRPLWSKVRHGYYGSNSASAKQGYELGGRYGPSAGSKNLEGALSPNQGIHEARIYTGGRKYDIENDNASEETILRESNAQSHKNNEVYCRTEISVNYTTANHERSSDNDK